MYNKDRKITPNKNKKYKYYFMPLVILILHKRG